MTFVAKSATLNARGFDTITPITDTNARDLKAAGFDFAIRYLGGLTLAEKEILLDAGLGLMCCTYADRYDGPAHVQTLRALGMPEGMTVWLDVEGESGDAGLLITKIRDWAKAIRNAGFDPGIYVGWNALLTSDELYALPVDRYWHSISRVLDRFGKLAEPGCGWCMHQLVPGDQRACGVEIDVDVIQQDYRGRVPTWAIKA